jgi:NAD(P)-dependent dehydrogenase (short-subunit alcohol dehydrogenase family)
MTTASTTPAWARSDTDLTGSTVLVIGGAGGVGEGVTQGLLKAGATVVATARSQSKLNELAARVDHPNLRTRTLDLLDPEPADTIAAIARENGGPLAGAAVAVSDWGRQGAKRIVDLTDAEWHALISANQTAVFRAYRAVVPSLAPGAALAQVNGIGADLPYPGNGVVGLAAAATKSMTRTLAEETRDSGLRVYELLLGFINTRLREQNGSANPDWIPASDIGTHVAELVAGTSPLTESVVHYFIEKDKGPGSTAPDFI